MQKLTLYRRNTNTFRNSQDEFYHAIGWLFQNDREEIAEELTKYFELGYKLDNAKRQPKKIQEKNEQFEDWKEAFAPVLSAIEASIKNQHGPEVLIDKKWREYKNQSPYFKV